MARRPHDPQQPDLAVEYVPTAELVPYARNAKLHPDEQVDAIAASIERFGNCDPVGVWTRPDGRLEIVEGHGRVMALKKLGRAEVPIIRLDHLDDDARRAYTHIHNQTTMSSGFEPLALSRDMAELPGFDWELFGFGSPACADDYGTDFELPDDDRGLLKMTCYFTSDQRGIVDEALGNIEPSGGGNDAGNRVAEVCRQWLELAT